MNREVRVMCDDCGTINRRLFVDMTTDEIGAELDESGWTRTEPWSGQDFCPNCTAKR